MCLICPVSNIKYLHLKNSKIDINLRLPINRLLRELNAETSYILYFSTSIEIRTPTWNKTEPRHKQFRFGTSSFFLFKPYFTIYKITKKPFNK